MCLQCCTEADHYGEFAPGWYLIRATKTAPDEMQAGAWGLVRTNDPDIMLDCPIRIPQTQAECFELLDAFSDQLYAPLPIGHKLYSALLKVQYPFAVKRLWAKFAITETFEFRVYLYLAWFIQHALKNNAVEPHR